MEKLFINTADITLRSFNNRYIYYTISRTRVGEMVSGEVEFRSISGEFLFNVNASVVNCGGDETHDMYLIRLGIPHRLLFAIGVTGTLLASIIQEDKANA